MKWSINHQVQKGNRYSSRDGNAPISLVFGSNSAPISTLTFSTDGFKDKTINKVTINCKRHKNANTSVSLLVNNLQVGEAQNIAGSFGDVTFDNLSLKVIEQDGFVLKFTNSSTSTSSNGGVYIHSIAVEFGEGITDPEEPKCAIPVAKVGDKVVVGNDKLFVNDELTFSCNTEGAKITYSLVGGDYNIQNQEYDDTPIKLNKAAIYNITAKATAGDLVSEELILNDIDVAKREAGISFSKATATAYLDAISEFSAPELLNPNKLGGISYTSSNPEIATVAADGTVAPLLAGETTITAEFAGNDEYEAAKAEYILNIMNEKPAIVTDILTPDSEFVTTDAGSSLYKNYTYTAPQTGITYAGNFGLPTGSAANAGTIQMRASDNSGIIVSSNNNGYVLRKIEIEWHSNTADNRKIDVYGNNSYTSTSDLYSTATRGTNIASLTKGALTAAEIEDNYAFIGIRCNANAQYISKITLTWEHVVVEPEAPAMPEIHPEHADKVSGNTISGEGSMNIKFADVEDHINLYYRFIDNTEKPEAVALDETADNHDGYELYDKENGLNLGTEHDGKTLEVFACDSNTGKHSEAAQYKISMLTVGVEEIEAAGAGEVRWFDMQGREVKGQPEKGIYVRVVNGKASKVIL